ncbi:MAG: BON domain-containing protein [Gemmatimonadaceae bacterium]
MPPFRYRDEDDSLGRTLAGLTIGALAGFAVGVVVAQKVGGVSALTERLRERFGFGSLADPEADREAALAALGDDEVFGMEEDDFEEEPDENAALEDRVLEAFRNDPILAERAVDIGAIGDGIIELSGWVDVEDESRHALTIARGVPGVETVVNRLVIGDEEELFEENARRAAAGDPSLTQAQWEGQHVGTGRRRQGNSAEYDRHADPKPEIEEKWLDETEAIRNAAEPTSGIAERRERAKKKTRGDRTGGSAVSPSGVPKADHVADQAPD